jgi:hypothetical protein
MEDPMRRSSDPLAGVLHERQWWDCRELRFKPTRHRSVRKSLEALAWKIDEASTRTKRQRDEEETRKEETRHAEEKARRQAEDEAARLLAEKERRFPRGRSKSISVEAKRKRQLKSPVGEMLNPDDRPAARRRVVLKPFTDEEKSARVRALADARRAHEEARRRSEANVQLTAKPAATSVKDTHRSRAKYHDPELIGRVTFNYSNNDGRYSIGQDEFFFETEWSKADDRSIHLLSGPPSIRVLLRRRNFGAIWV